jgi:2-dehydro-3-deoxygluconokinase
MPLPSLHAAGTCRHDLTALGEVMLRLDPGEGRIRTARTFTAWEGGGEYNVARSLSRCFGLKTALVSALADNEIGHLIEGLILQGGVDASHVNWLPYDGLGRTVRNGLNFTERGFGVRGALGVSDRGHTAASQICPGDIDWDAVFAPGETRWFHTGGVFAALSESTAQVVLEAIAAAKRHGVIVSYDLNYRPSLWSGRGGKTAADALNRTILASVDVLFGVDGVHDEIDPFGDLAPIKERILQLSAEFSALQVVATPLRRVHSAVTNDWSGLLWADGGFFRSRHYPAMAILDRVGGGDAFAAGVIHGLLTGSPLQEAVEIATAHGALAMTTPGDTSMASLEDVRKLAAGGGAKVDR